MFGGHSRLVVDIVLDINKDEVYKNEYIREVRQSLQKAYFEVQGGNFKK